MRVIAFQGKPFSIIVNHITLSPQLDCPSNLAKGANHAKVKAGGHLAAQKQTQPQSEDVILSKYVKEKKRA